MSRMDGAADGLKAFWNEMGLRDPFWAIRSIPGLENGRTVPATFFESGRSEIRWMLQYLIKLGINLRNRQALDVGCGIGRQTQALCEHFEWVHGVDVAPSMIDLARRYNRYGIRCQFWLGSGHDLSLFRGNAFDFVYSNCTLQHVRQETAARYISEFSRILRYQGLAVFQIPEYCGKGQISTDLRSGISSLPTSEVMRILCSVGLPPVAYERNENLAMLYPDHVNCVYVARKVAPNGVVQ
jgi:SAM-dependent methyltransferase